MMLRHMRMAVALLATGLLAGCGTVASSPSDDLLDDVRGRLSADPSTSRCNIHATLMDGVVTLSGSVPDENVRVRAKSIVRGADGVKGVVDNLVTP